MKLFYMLTIYVICNFQLVMEVHVLLYMDKIKVLVLAFKQVCCSLHNNHFMFYMVTLHHSFFNIIFLFSISVVARQLGNQTTGYMTWKAGSGSSLETSLVKESANSRLQLGLQVYFVFFVNDNLVQFL